jgi:hypothetical protein
MAYVCNAGFTVTMNGTEPMDCRWKQCTGGEVLVLSSPFCSNTLFLNLVSPPSFRTLQISSSLGSSPLPTYDPIGGSQGKGHVSCDRSQSQYLDAGPRTLNITTNGGLTIVVVVRFTGTVGDYEKIIDLGSGSPDNNIILGRYADITYSSIAMEVANGGVFLIDGRSDGQFRMPFGQGSWLTIVVRYLASTRECVVKVNNDKYVGTASKAV